MQPFFRRNRFRKTRKTIPHIEPTMHELLPAVEYGARNQAVFDAESRTYCDFLEKLSHIQSLYAP